MADDNLEARRQQARLAMEGEETAKRHEAETAILSKRRLEAQIAMESEEQKRSGLIPNSWQGPAPLPKNA